MSYVNFMSDPKAVWDRYDSFGGNVAFDIGANGGMTALIFARRFAKVVACEPAEESYGQLVASAAENVVPVQVAVSDHDGAVTLGTWSVTESMGELITGDSLAVSWGEPTGMRTVPCVTLDTLAGEHGRPDFVKIDTEGHERAVLEGAEETFARPVQFVIEIHSLENHLWIEQWLEEKAQVFHKIRGYRDISPYYDQHLWIVSGGA